MNLSHLSELEQRLGVVTEARKWIGTRYHHQGAVLGAGIDCGMLLVRVFCDTGLVPEFDPRPYSRDWYFHRDEDVYLGFVNDRSKEVDTPALGDIAIWKVGRAFAHGAIVVSWPTVIHAVAQEGMCLEQPIVGNRLAESPVRFFSYWGGK